MAIELGSPNFFYIIAIPDPRLNRDKMIAKVERRFHRVTGQEHDLKTKSPSLQALLRSLSKLRFENISGRKVDLVKDHPNPDYFVYGSHQTVIQIASKDLRITFKSHFTVSNT
ncbi:MAG: hypothetical protein EOP10_24135, partial [Proteobacteria bacterium]